MVAYCSTKFSREVNIYCLYHYVYSFAVCKPQYSSLKYLNIVYHLLSLVVSPVLAYVRLSSLLFMENHFQTKTAFFISLLNNLGYIIKMN